MTSTINTAFRENVLERLPEDYRHLVAPPTGSGGEERDLLRAYKLATLAVEWTGDGVGTLIPTAPNGFEAFGEVRLPEQGSPLQQLGVREARAPPHRTARAGSLARGGRARRRSRRDRQRGSREREPCRLAENAAKILLAVGDIEDGWEAICEKANEAMQLPRTPPAPGA